MKLELKHLAPYLPYGLKAEMLAYQRDYVGRQYDEIIGIHQWSKNKDWCLLTDGGSKPSFDCIKPILRPLSDLTKEIDHNGERFVPSDRTQAGSKHGRVHSNIGVVENRITTNTITYSDMTYLISLHFDVFGLIPEGLAIDINTL